MNNPVKQVQEQLDDLYAEHRDLAYRLVTSSLTVSEQERLMEVRKTIGQLVELKIEAVNKKGIL